MLSSAQSEQIRSACSECQRRKQKCDKQWPCCHCLKRNIGDKCRYTLPASLFVNDAIDIAKTKTPQSKKRQVETQHEPGGAIPGPTAATSAHQTLESVGYNTADMLASFGLHGSEGSPSDGQYWSDAKSCAPLQRAISILPQRQWVDSFLQTFFSNINTQFAIIYSTSFIEEYRIWWGRINNQTTVGLHWTCLLLVVCACSVQHANPATRAAIEFEMKETVDALSEELHNAARELGSAIPLGYNHLYGCQWHLYSAYWYISQGRYPETWHVLNAAAREAHELGLDSDEDFGHLPHFDREMRRRVYCILQILDWQISAGLSKATIVHWSKVDVPLPTLTMEGIDPPPMLHMSLQSELISNLARQYPSATNAATPKQVINYQETVMVWGQKLPPVYALMEPDTSKDGMYPWVAFNRMYLYTMFYYLQLTVIRPYMAKGYTNALPNDELYICEEGIRCCRENLKVAIKWADHISVHGGGFHWVIASALDTIVLLCTSLVKDVGNTLPKDATIYVELDDSTELLGRLAHTSPIGKLAHDTCVQVTGALPRPATFSNSHKRLRINSGPTANLPTVPSYDNLPFDQTTTAVPSANMVNDCTLISSGSLVTPESDNTADPSPHLQPITVVGPSSTIDRVTALVVGVESDSMLTRPEFDFAQFDLDESQHNYTDSQLDNLLSEIWYQYWE